MNRLYAATVVFMIACGVLVRISVYLNNRNLFIDEANVARNLVERGFWGLALPLKYEQSAPLMFLWITKAFTNLFGMHEYALRLYPVMAGIAALVIVALILRETVAPRVSWYAMGYFAMGYIFVRYSTELKQYMPDVLIVSSLQLLALRTELSRCGPRRFILLWTLVGSFAIWASMPAIFGLAGVTAYYGVNMWRQDRPREWGTILVPAAIWAVQFGLYYGLLLMSQATSEVMQSYHRDYFLYLWPWNLAQWTRNWQLMTDIVGVASGRWPVALWFHLILLVVGMARFLAAREGKGFLIVIPIVCLLAAAALHRYSLVARMTLFALPSVLILISHGFDTVLKIPPWPLRVLMTLLAIRCLSASNSMGLLVRPMVREEITLALEYVQSLAISGPDLVVDGGAWPAFTYYTRIHPDHRHWQGLAGARRVRTAADYADAMAQAGNRVAFINTNMAKTEWEHQRSRARAIMRETAKLEAWEQGAFAYLYER